MMQIPVKINMPGFANKLPILLPTDNAPGRNSDNCFFFSSRYNTENKDINIIAKIII